MKHAWSIWAGLLGVALSAGSLEAQQKASVDARCKPAQPAEKVAQRASPYASTAVEIGGQSAVICYGRPSARGRTMIGGKLVPYGKQWRTGANEPTIVHVPFAAEIAGIAVAPGSYSIYTIPQKGDWTLIVNRSTSQWGHENAYTAEVKAQEVGRAAVRSVRLDDHVETFTIRSAAPGQGAADVVLEWEHTRVVVPIRRKG